MSDEQPTQPTEQPPSEPRQPRRFYRSRRDRMIAGVAGGLGSYFGVDPLIVRIAFGISIFFGGLGLLAYVALVLFVPSEPGSDGEASRPPIERSRGLAIAAGIGLVVIALSWGIFDGPFHRGGGFFLTPLVFFLVVGAAAVAIARRGAPSVRARSTLAGVLLAIVAFVGLSILGLLAAWAGATGHGVAVGAAVVGIGVLLIAAAFAGGGRWLIAPAIALAVPLGLVAATDISFGDGVGEREYRPASVASIPSGGYELGIGRLVVDLRDLDWKPGTQVDLNVDLGIGEAIVAVPSDVCVTTDVSAKAGDLRVAGDQTGGMDIEKQVNLGVTTMPRLDLTGEVDLGQLRVINDDDLDFGRDDHFFSRRGESANSGQMAADLTAACEPDPAASGVGGGNDGAK